MVDSTPIGGGRRRSATWLLPATLLFVAGCGIDTGRSRATLPLTECRLPRLPTSAQCGELDVPENRSRPDGRRIKLAVAVLPALTLSPQRDPLFILAGGPGQAASMLGPFAAQLAGVRKERDIVLIDQRGTGRSSPLRCAAFQPEPGLDDALELDPLPKARACADELAAQGVDLAQYTTAAWVADLDAARAALGYEVINLWGGSYGTRVALEYLRRHGSRVRSAILDGVAPPRMRISLEVWITRDAALAATLAACLQAPSCSAAHPGLADALERVRSNLGATGHAVALADPRTGEVATLSLRYEHVIAALQPLTYVPELRALIPEIIDRAAAGDFGPLFAATSMLTAELSDQMNVALHYSVTCTEDTARVAAGEAHAALSSLLAPGLPQRVLAVCAFWPKGERPSDAATPVASAVPVLLLSGGLDPVTPPAHAAEVARTLPNSRQVIAPGFGHIVSPHGCAPRLIAAFIETADGDRLPAACVEHFRTSTPPPLWPNRLAANR
jgi:pimeloyl-ACP methyl ester carboxylesterase